MAGGSVATGPCIICRNNFAFNPETVPSMLYAGARRPVCEPCVPAVNEELERLGRTDRLTILPTSYSIEES